MNHIPINYIEIFFTDYSKFNCCVLTDYEHELLMFVVLFKYSQLLSKLLICVSERTALNLISLSLSRFNHKTTPQWVITLI